MEISPDYSWAYYNLASIAYKNGNIEEAKEYLQKTIEYNSFDIEAYKLLTKISIKDGAIDEILETLHSAVNKNENGDLYYCLARIYKFIGDSDEYYDCLKNALKNPYTLTFPQKTVQKEFEAIQEKLGKHETIEPETSVEEYVSDEDPEVDFSEEDLESEAIN